MRTTYHTYSSDMVPQVIRHHDHSLSTKLVFEGRDHRGGIPSARRITMQLLPVVTHISAFGFKSDLKNCYYTNISFWFSKTHKLMQLFPVSTLSLLPAYRSVAITNAKHSKSTSLE